MTLNEIKALTNGMVINGGRSNVDIPVAKVTEDSRKVEADTLFVPLQGQTVDGHEYIGEALKSGAVGIMTDTPEKIPPGVLTMMVPHARRALGQISHGMLENPSREMKVIGVTGTNGKSSTVMIIQHMLSSTGHPTASFGTLGYTAGGKTREAPHTTPFGEDLARLFAEARDAGDTHVVMEVSSHAIDQERIAGIDFDVALFTNLTQDHLDYHETMQQYLTSKTKLFSKIKSSESKFTVANSDDPSAGAFRLASKAPHYTFGAEGEVSILEFDMKGNRCTFSIESPWGNGSFEMGLLGMHNVRNAVAAITVCGYLGVPFEKMQSAVASMPPVPGRFESIDSGQDFQVIVDYAHTEDGLRNVLSAAREVCNRRLIVLFGCGGDRDTTKRPKMAAAVAELADFGIVTSDNPRSESPELILLDIEVGMQHASKKRDEDYVVIEDRRDAIHSALAMANAGDLVMIAGKGHEDYQELASGRIHFDDREVVREWLENRS
jgi:UDP-N-acetylmuramoyl-L-alanyl-D-glutamate--2,6-diaminopimelate ligase